MDAFADRPEFAPPPQPGQLRAFGLAIGAHLLLLVALTHGLHWQREVQNAAVEAELWSKLPTEAAPVAPPPPPPPPPPPVVQAPPPPPPVVRAPPEPQVNRDAQIALEREKEKREQALERERERKAEQARQRKAEAERERRAEAEAQRRKEAALKKQEEELAKKRELQKQQVAEAKKREEEKKRKLAEQEARDAKRREEIREAQIKRSLAMAGTGGPSSQGTAERASGPSASWAGRVQARVRPNIVFADAVSGNPKATVEVRLAPDGTIVGKRLLHSSGVKAWDDAVLRALDKTEVLPRDVDGRVPSPVEIEFRPRG